MQFECSNTNDDIINEMISPSSKESLPDIASSGENVHDQQFHVFVAGYVNMESWFSAVTTFFI